VGQFEIMGDAAHQNLEGVAGSVWDELNYKSLSGFCIDYSGLGSGSVWRGALSESTGVFLCDLMKIRPRSKNSFDT